jgi:hypothetical protein
MGVTFGANKIEDSSIQKILNGISIDVEQDVLFASLYWPLLRSRFTGAVKGNSSLSLQSIEKRHHQILAITL